MTQGGRRAALGLLLAAGLLFGGRALVGYLADRWWLEAAAPEALPFFVHRTLLGAALDLGVVLLTWLWWAGHGLGLVAVSRASPPGSGNAAIRRGLQHVDARLWTLVLAGALALLTGLGASAWAEPLLLAREDVRFGLPDPALGLDAGTLVARLPVWLRLHAFLTLLILTTLGVMAAGHLMVGGVRIGRGRASITTASRRQLGLLLAALAGVLAIQQILIPFEQAAGLPRPMEPGAVLLHRSVSFVLVGVGLGVIALSLVWAFRPVHALAAGGWLALCTALLAGFYFLPEGDPWPMTAEEWTVQIRFEQAAFGIEPPDGATLVPDGHSAPSLWDDSLVERLFAREGGEPVPVTRLLSSGLVPRPAWAAIRSTEHGTVALYAVADDTVGPSGVPLFLTGRPAGLSRTAEPLLALSDRSARPGAPGVVVGSGVGGVRLGGWARRLALAWALQSSRVFGPDREGRVEWRLDPLERLSWLAPFAVWSTPRMILDGDEPVWVADGVVIAETFPGARPQQWRGRRINFGRVGFLGVVQAESGVARIYLHPEPDSLSAAWARVGEAMVRPAAELPPFLAGRHGSPLTELELQSPLLVLNEARQLDRRPEDLEPLVPPLLLDRRAVLAVSEPSAGRLHALFELIPRASGRARMVVHRTDTVRVEAPEDLARRWRGLPALQVIRDSVEMAGDSFEEGGRVRYVRRDSGLLAYQPMYAVGRSGGRISVVLVVAAEAGLAALGRTLPEALESLASAEAAGQGESALLIEARRWIREADSALRRGDLAAFANAFAALRNLLEGRERR